MDNISLISEKSEDYTENEISGFGNGNGYGNGSEVDFDDFNDSEDSLE